MAIQEIPISPGLKSFLIQLTPEQGGVRAISLPVVENLCITLTPLKLNYTCAWYHGGWNREDWFLDPEEPGSGMFKSLT